MNQEQQAAYRASWQRAMDKAEAEGLQAVEIAQDRLYMVRSTSKSECSQHIVGVNAEGKIESCSDCKGWEFYQTAVAELRYDRAPCKHSGAVARRLIRERSRSHRQPERIVPPPEALTRPALAHV